MLVLIDLKLVMDRFQASCAMPIHVKCDCGRLLVVPDTRRGKPVGCPHCGSALVVPDGVAGDATCVGARASSEPSSSWESRVPARPASPPPPSPPPPPPSPPPEPPAVSGIAAEECVEDLPLVVDAHVEVRRANQRNAEHQAVQLLASAVVLVAAFNVIPVLLSVLGPRETWNASGTLERWAVGLLWISIVYVVYAFYLVQIPDWSSIRVVALVTLTVTSVYAALAGLRLLAAGGNWLMQYLDLDGNRFSSAQEAGWCFIMVLLTGSLSYAAGRYSSRWSRAAGMRP